ncbi:MAG: ABC transporter substrate-binding protein, partial [Thermoanaerobaculales bacterium]|nr:ABC transporter substrate-binding protein [Thermoanaerobaculales bacterium]
MIVGNRRSALRWPLAAVVLTLSASCAISRQQEQQMGADYSTQIALIKNDGVEIINTFPIPPDFAAFWRQAAQQGLTRQIKIMQTAKTGLFPSDIEALGSLGLNISSAAYWHRDFPYTSPLTGLDGPALSDGWEAATGEQWTQQLGATLSLLDAGVEALKASSDPKSREAIRDAIAVLNVETIAGKVDFTSGPVPNVSPGPIIGTQWIASEGGKFPL